MCFLMMLQNVIYESHCEVIIETLGIFKFLIPSMHFQNQTQLYILFIYFSARPQYFTKLACILTLQYNASCNLQMKPNNSFPFDTTISVKNESSLQVLSQTWHKSGSCPKGTIPIRRISRQELLRATSLEHFGFWKGRTTDFLYCKFNK